MDFLIVIISAFSGGIISYIFFFKKGRTMEISYNVEKEKVLELKTQFSSQKDDFKNELTLMTQEVISSLKSENKTNVESLTLPLSNQLNEFKKYCEEQSKDAAIESGKFTSEIEMLKKMSSNLNTEAQNLTRALNNDNKALGCWGEHTFEMLLQSAGLNEGLEYQKEVSQKNQYGESLRPDFIIYLPDNKEIIVDSKVVLSAYQDAVNLDVNTSNIDEKRKELLGCVP